MKALLVFLTTLSGVEALEELRPEYWQAEVGIENAIRFHDEDQVTERALRGEFLAEDSRQVGFYKAKARWNWNTIYYDDHPYSEQAEEDYKFDKDLRHLYIGTAVGNAELTLGWQQIVWGRADELRVLDQINPVDYRDGVAEPLEKSRIALPMLRYSQPISDWHLDTLLLLDFKQNRFPTIGSEFSSGIFLLPDENIFSVVPASFDDTHDEFSYGAHLNGNLGGIDTSIVLLDSRQFDPVYSTEGMTSEGRVRLSEQFPRYSMAGIGVAADLGYSMVLRSEIAYFDSLTFTNPQETEGISTSSVVKGMLGIDYLWRDWLFTTQFWRQHITDWTEGNLDPADENLVTFSAEGLNFSGRLTSRLIVAYSPPFDENALFQSMFIYRPTDSIRLSLQIDIYTGKKETLFGSYDDKDNFQFSIDFLFN